MSLSDKEKECLNSSNDFLMEAAKQLGFRGFSYNNTTATTFTADMLGQIAADKYRECMRSPNDRDVKRSR